MLSYKVPFPTKSLIELFSDLKEYAKVHPLILNAKGIVTNQNKYRITEKPFRYLPIRISYFVMVNSSTNEIEYSISKIPLSKLTIKYTFLNFDFQTTEIKCLLELKSKLVGKSILFRKIIKAQNELMYSLPQYFNK
jgi:ribosome-associated toxin RatA of RatAB toxin-antitoxin module